MLYIVLPPELSRRSIQILIQYMYSGEATVSNDILNEVLRGGELLKIRGLWRNNQTNESNACSTPHSQPPKIIDPIVSSTKDGLPTIGAEKSVFEHRLTERIPPVVAGCSAVIKESPVIVMSPQQHHSAVQCIAAAQPPPTQHMVQLPPPHQHQQQPVQNVLVKRENVLTELTETSVPSLHYGLVSLQIAAAAVKKAQLPSEMTSRIKSTNGSMETSIRRYSMDQMKDAEQRAASKENDTSMRLGDKRRVSIAEQQRSGHHLEPGEKSGRYSGGKLIMDKNSVDVQIPEALNFLTIKQEPIEWSEYDAENGIEKSQIEVTVKPEMVYTNDESEEEGKIVVRK